MGREKDRKLLRVCSTADLCCWRPYKENPTPQGLKSMNCTALGPRP